MTQERATLFRENSILCIVIPSNIINSSQPLNFTVNGHCKLLIKKLMDGLPKSLTKSSLFIKNWKRWRWNFTSPKRDLFMQNGWHNSITTCQPRMDLKLLLVVAKDPVFLKRSQMALLFALDWHIQRRCSFTINKWCRQWNFLPNGSKRVFR